MTFRFRFGKDVFHLSEPINGMLFSPPFDSLKNLMYSDSNVLFSAKGYTMKTKALTREGRKAQVITLLAIRIDKALPNEITVREVAKSLDITPSTKLRNIMLEMVADGELVLREKPMAGIAGRKFIFSLPDGSFTKSLLRRVININSRGKTEQVRMDI